MRQIKNKNTYSLVLLCVLLIISVESSAQWSSGPTLGEEVAEVVKETLPPGKHSISFNASELTSGIYFYKISSGSFNQAEKMILTR